MSSINFLTSFNSVYNLALTIIRYFPNPYIYPFLLPTTNLQDPQSAEQYHFVLIIIATSFGVEVVRMLIVNVIVRRAFGINTISKFSKVYPQGLGLFMASGLVLRV